MQVFCTYTFAFLSEYRFCDYSDGNVSWNATFLFTRKTWKLVRLLHDVLDALAFVFYYFYIRRCSRLEFRRSSENCVWDSSDCQVALDVWSIGAYTLWFRILQKVPYLYCFCIVCILNTLMYSTICMPIPTCLSNFPTITTHRNLLKHVLFLHFLYVWVTL